MAFLAFVHALAALWLAVYGLNSFILALLYLRYRRVADPSLPLDAQPAPFVTIQVPVYNERHVIERVIDAVAKLSYPRERFEVQILDDSDDDTTQLAQARAALHRARGLDIRVLRRPTRDGYKAGALAWGLCKARGEFVAIFDADFCPHPDFLSETIPHFLTHPDLGVVQARWSYLNAAYSPVTRAQALALDGHFAVEQVGRCRSALLMNFNGAGGVWRRRCIEQAGGWRADTVCEDLDLSYRAQMAGWECLFLPGVDVPTELPPQITAFKRQQSRWAQGSAQCLRQAAGPLLRHQRLSWWQKMMALVHLSSYLAHPLMVILLIASLPLLLLPASAQIPLGGLGLMYLGPPLVYVLSQRQLYADWKRRLVAFPVLAAMGIGVAWCNTKAVWRGLTRWGGTFARTPKFQLEGQAGQWSASQYRLRAGGGTIGEIALALYATITAVVALITGHYGVLPNALLYAVAFGAVAVMELAQGAVPSRRSPWHQAPVLGKASYSQRDSA